MRRPVLAAVAVLGAAAALAALPGALHAVPRGKPYPDGRPPVPAPPARGTDGRGQALRTALSARPAAGAPRAGTASPGHPPAAGPAAARARPGRAGAPPGAAPPAGPAGPAAAQAAAYEGLPGLGPAGGAIRVPPAAAALVDPLPANGPNLTLGRAVYAEYCEVCHGSDLRGHGPAAANLSPGPADLRAPHLRHWAPGQFYWVVSHGLRGTGMPPWAEMLTPRQRWAVVDFVRYNLLPAPAPDPQFPPAARLPLQGPVALAAGQALYAQDCAVCHGVNGEGLGPAGRYLDPRPTDLTAPYVQAFTGAQLSTILRDGIPGTPMPAWGSLLSPDERAYVVLFLRKLQADAAAAAAAASAGAPAATLEAGARCPAAGGTHASRASGGGRPAAGRGASGSAGTRTATACPPRPPRRGGHAA